MLISSRKVNVNLQISGYIHALSQTSNVRQNPYSNVSNHDQIEVHFCSLTLHPLKTVQTVKIGIYNRSYDDMSRTSRCDASIINER